MTRRTVHTVLGVLAVYLFVRGIVELVTIDYGDPSSYGKDWGGPSLAGVLAVHVGPGLLAAVWAAGRLVRRRREQRS